MMTISHIAVYKYKLPLTQTIHVKQHKLDAREGFIVQLTSNGVDGFGEIAPLPGFNKESMAEVLRQLEKVKAFFQNRPILNGLEKLDGQMQKWLKPLNLSASVQCGVEMAVLNLIANARKKTLHQLISTEGREHIRLSGLIQGSKEEVMKQAQHLIDQGYRAMKLKVGGNIQESIEKVKAVNEVIWEKAVLHVDANQAWSVKDATEFANAIGPAAVDYIEEPFADTEKIDEFFDATLIPVALDESISTLSFDEVKSLSGVDVIVLKPTVLGGIEKTWQMMQLAKAKAILPIISSSYESSVGILTLANIAGSLSRDNEAGLDTLKWFKKDLLKDPLPINHGKIDISSFRIEAANLNFDLLEKVI